MELLSALVLSLHLGCLMPLTSAKPYDNFSTSAAQQGKLRTSSQLGVNHCEIPGILGGEPVLFHIWMRMIPPAVAAQSLCSAASPQLLSDTCNRTALVRGFAYIVSHQHPMPAPRRTVQILQAKYHYKWNKKLFLRSARTGAQYPLQVEAPRAHHSPTPDHPHLGNTDHPIMITGQIALQPEDVDALDFEVRVDQFVWHCGLLVTPPVLSITPSTEGNIRDAEDMGDWADVDDAADVGDADHASDTTEAPDSEDEAVNMWPDAQGNMISSSAWSFVPEPSLTDKTQVWQMLPPFFSMNMRHYAELLWYWDIWHQRMGVNKILLYTQESPGTLLREPLIRKMMRAGRLEVVMFTELPKHEKRFLKPTKAESYAMQIIAYNHGNLALWGSDSLVLSVDIDEYLATPTPMTIIQAYTQCPSLKGGDIPEILRPVNATDKQAAILIRRTDVLCIPSATADQCNPTQASMLAWTAGDLHAVLSGAAPHPMTWHTMGSASDLWVKNSVKPLFDPSNTCGAHVHSVSPCNGSVYRVADTDCIRLLHLTNMYRVRRDPAGSYATQDQYVGSQKWWWPVTGQHSQTRQDRPLTASWLLRAKRR